MTGLPLNQWQRAVVESRAPLLVVRAGPGSGKTATIAHLAAEAARAGLDPRRIGIFTFGRRAAGEVQSRLRSLGVRRVHAGTLHGMAYRLVRHHHAALEYRERPVLYSSGEREDLIARALVGTRGVTPAALRRQLDASASGAPCPPNLEEPLRRYWSQLRRDGAADYGLLTIDAVRILESPGFAKPFDLAIIDEGQDLDRLQARLARALTGGRLVAVADPDQAIFAWRGAHPRWAEEDESRELLTLPKSYRCPATILDHARWMLGEDRELIPADHAGQVVHCEPEEWCGLIVDELGKSGTSAVLCRTNAECDRASAELLLKEISHRRHAAGDQILEREQVRDVLALLAFPEMRRSKWVLLRIGRMFGLGSIALTQIIAAAAAGEITLYDECLAQAPAVAAHYAADPPGSAMLERLSSAIARVRPEPRSSDWMLEHAADFAVETPIADQTASNLMAHLGACDDLLPGEEDSRTVVMTMHAAKGLEFDDVTIFADRRPAKWKEHPDPDERRLLYVSATRARRRLILMTPAFARPWWTLR